jgi:hypothetical protein
VLPKLWCFAHAGKYKLWKTGVTHTPHFDIPENLNQLLPLHLLIRAGSYLKQAAGHGCLSVNDKEG